MTAWYKVPSFLTKMWRRFPYQTPENKKSILDRAVWECLMFRSTNLPITEQPEVRGLVGTHLES